MSRSSSRSSAIVVALISILRANALEPLQRAYQRRSVVTPTSRERPALRDPLPVSHRAPASASWLRARIGLGLHGGVHRVGRCSVFGNEPGLIRRRYLVPKRCGIGDRNVTAFDTAWTTAGMASRLSAFAVDIVRGKTLPSFATL